LLTGASQTVIPRMSVTADPKITACHALIRNTASNSREQQDGYRHQGEQVDPATECSGFRT
jgi:hypothetical protein